MTVDTKPFRRGGVFYGWFALAGAMLVYFTGCGIFFYSYGVFLPTMCDELGWSRAAMAAGLSLGTLTFGLPSPLIGASIARFGPRINMVLGNLLAAIGLAGVSLVQEVWHLYFFYSLSGLGIGFGMYMASTTVVNNWFIQKRSLGMGLVIAAGGMGGFVLPPLVTWLISSIGWQMSWVVVAGIHFTIAVLMGGLILIRNRPEDLGQGPDGLSTEPASEKEGIDNRSRVDQSPVDLLTKQEMHKPTTWLIAAINAANFFAIGAVMAHQVAYLKDLSFTPMVAAMALSLVSGMSIVGRLGFGALALRFDVRRLAIVSFAVQLIGLAILLTTANLALIYVYAVLFGISCGGLIVALPTFIGEYYERTYYAQILGTIFPLGTIAEAMGPVLAGAIHDATATYTLAFTLVTAFSLVGLVCAILVRPPKLQQ
ncbi:MAG: MFS transporter [Candidatus Bathyarchaeota archaeon]|nr:MAG: MFS transporter [Candidatus Bathyarchaeota archaeon]